MNKRILPKDLRVLPKELRSIWNDDDRLTSTSSSSSSVVFIDKPTPQEEEDSNILIENITKQQQLTDHFGNPLIWNVEKSAFTTSNDTNIATNKNNPEITMSETSTIALISKQHQLETLLQQYEKNADQLLLNIPETNEFSLTWDEIAYFALSKSTVIQQSRFQFKQTLSKFNFNISNNQHQQKERKLIQWWLANKGDQLLIH